MGLTLGLAGDTMFGRKVAERLRQVAPAELFDDAVVKAAREADLFLLNLECCISERGERWPDPRKPFFFRAPPVAVEALTHLGVDVVTLANNHALDFGPEALLDTVTHLDAAGIAHVGAGSDEAAARTPAVLDVGGLRVGVIGVSDHPEDFAAGPDTPGIAFADLHQDVPDWVRAAIASLQAELVVVSPHWGPNMTTAPVAHVRRAAPVLAGAGATLVAGHSAHVFHGVGREQGVPILFDLGDFIDDYAVDELARNDLGMLWLVRFEGVTPTRLEALPLFLEYCYTRLADDEEFGLVGERFLRRCAELGSDVTVEDGRLTVALT